MAKNDGLHALTLDVYWGATGGGVELGATPCRLRAASLGLGFAGFRVDATNALPRARRLDIAYDAEVPQNLIRVRLLTDRHADRASTKVGSEGGVLAIIDRAAQRDRA